MFLKQTILIAITLFLTTQALPNPTYKQTRQETEPQILILPPICNNFPQALGQNIRSSIKVLKARPGWFTAKPGPGGCSKLSCTDSVAAEDDTRPTTLKANGTDCIWYCNDFVNSDKGVVLANFQSYKEIGDVAETLMDACEPSVDIPFSGQVWGEGALWNVVIGHYSSIPAGEGTEGVLGTVGGGG